MKIIMYNQFIQIWLIAKSPSHLRPTIGKSLLRLHHKNVENVLIRLDKNQVTKSNLEKS